MQFPLSLSHAAKSIREGGRAGAAEAGREAVEREEAREGERGRGREGDGERARCVVRTFGHCGTVALFRRKLAKLRGEVLQALEDLRGVPRGIARRHGGGQAQQQRQRQRSTKERVVKGERERERVGNEGERAGKWTRRLAAPAEREMR